MTISIQATMSMTEATAITEFVKGIAASITTSPTVITSLQETCDSLLRNELKPVIVDIARDALRAAGWIEH